MEQKKQIQMGVLPLSQRKFYYDDKTRGVSKKAINELLPIVNERRPFCTKDFKKQHFIAELF